MRQTSIQIWWEGNRKSRSGKMNERQKKHFVLVHGAGHGAWCWYKVTTELRAAGHRVTALDMAASGVNPKQVDELSSMCDYFQPLMEFMESLPSDDRVVLVGHSAGGRTKYHQHIEGFDWMDSQHQFREGLDKPPTSILFGPKYLESKLYSLSSPEDLTLATLLVRPHPLFLDELTLLKETALTQENYGSVRRVCVLIEEDEVINESFQRWMIDNNPPNEVRVIPDADHMVMLSKPKELIACLLELAS